MKMHFLVFGSIRRPLMGGGKYLDWSNDQNPLGVFEGEGDTTGEAAENACKAAAQESSAMGTFFAVPGFVWGLELMAHDGRRFGSTDSPMDRLNQRLGELAERDAKRDEILTRLLTQGEDGG